MKGYCFLILAVAFLMYFQKEPVFTVIILGIGVVVYLFIKARKRGKGVFGFLGGVQQPHNDRMNDLMTLILLQQLLSDTNSTTNQSEPSSSSSDKKEQEEVKQEIMALFDKYDMPQNKKVSSQKR